MPNHYIELPDELHQVLLLLCEANGYTDPAAYMADMLKRDIHRGPDDPVHVVGRALNAVPPEGQKAYDAALLCDLKKRLGT